MFRHNLSVALIQSPVLNKNGASVTTSIMTLNLHDIARLARTYDLKRFYLVSDDRAQRALAARLSAHWLEGFGSRYNASRKEALKTLIILDSIEAIYKNYMDSGLSAPKLLVTSAVDRDSSSTELAERWRAARAMVNSTDETLALFGTGYGLTRATLEMADFKIPPIEGMSDYNHLSVRVAAAIIVDRLLGSLER